MATESKKDLNCVQILGAVLIILALILLYCLSKNSSQEGYCQLATRNPASGGLRCTDGFDVKAHMPDLRFSEVESMDKKNMNDLETNTLNRHAESQKLMHEKPDVTGLRWASESLISGSDINSPFGSGCPVYSDDLNGDSNKHLISLRDYSAVTVGGDILTPLKPTNWQNECKSHSEEVLMKTDYAPVYSQARGRISF